MIHASYESVGKAVGRPTAIVIGAGSTGAATAHDLALRGVAVTVVERGEIASGTTGRNHGLLHSGARYAVKDPESAAECIVERDTLARIVPEVLELNGGVFVALDEAGLAYHDSFLEACARSGIPTRELTAAEARDLEPQLSERVLAAIEVPDGVFDPLHVCLAFLATAQAHGATVLPYTEVGELIVHGTSVEGVIACDRRTGGQFPIEADVVINAGGPWAGRIAAMAGVDVPVVPTAGVMVAVARTIRRSSREPARSALGWRHRSPAAQHGRNRYLVVAGRGPGRHRHPGR